MLVQRGGVAERDRRRQTVKPGKPDMPGGILDYVAVQVLEWTAGTDGRRYILVAEQSIEASVAARFIRQHVWGAAVGRRAYPVAGGAMDANADEAVASLRRVGGGFQRLR